MNDAVGLGSTRTVSAISEQFVERSVTVTKYVPAAIPVAGLVVCPSDQLNDKVPEAPNVSAKIDPSLLPQVGFAGLNPTILRALLLVNVTVAVSVHPLEAPVTVTEYVPTGKPVAKTEVWPNALGVHW